MPLTDSQLALKDLLRVLCYSDKELTRELNELMHQYGIDDAFKSALDEAEKSLPEWAIKEIQSWACDSSSIEQCDRCMVDLEQAQIGLCDDCQHQESE